MDTHRALALALAVAVVACSDQTVTAPSAIESLPPAASARATVRGIVVVSRDIANVLLEIDGVLFEMQGDKSVALANVAGAEVLVVGTWDAADGGLIVERFSVLAMGGRASYDGILELHQDAYAIRLLGNELHWLADVPATLSELVGSRIWLTERVNDLPVAFGVISLADFVVTRR